MSNLDLAMIRAMNAKPDEDCPGYWQRTIAALCDEVERLRAPQLPSDLDAIRRIADSGAPIPPWLVRSLCNRVEAVEHLAQAYLDATTAFEASVVRGQLRAALGNEEARPSPPVAPGVSPAASTCIIKKDCK